MTNAAARTRRDTSRRVPGRTVWSTVALALCVALLPSALLPSASFADDQTELLKRLQKLEANQEKLYELLRQKDERLDALEKELLETTKEQKAGTADALSAENPAPPAAKSTSAEPATNEVQATVAAPPAEEASAPSMMEETTSAASPASPATTPGETSKVDAEMAKLAKLSAYTPGRGFTIIDSPYGGVNFGVYTYLRYLNQKGLSKYDTDGLGNQQLIHRRDDLELNKVKLEFRGWMLNPHFRWVLYTWTNQAAQGQGAQVVVGGNLNWNFGEWLNVGGGILSLPTTRSTSGNFPNWLSVDHRTLSDEFFRGSYASGFFAYGATHGIGYYAMLSNNLSILGVDANQLDSDFTTISAALWWMPTTGEFGPRSGFGDYEMHQDVATRIGAHFTFSPEDRQSQPSTDDIDNTQIRLSNGTIVFTPGALAPGVAVEKVKYYMGDIDAGIKYRGLALEAEYYLRWLNDFKADGPLPINTMFDHGFQVLASGMAIPEALQLYSTGSYLFGEYGDAWEIAAGLNWWPFHRREIRLNLEYLYDHESPIGYTAVPQTVGATGSIFNANLELSF